MMKSEADKSTRREEAQRRYEKIMKKIEPFIPQTETKRPLPPDVWRRGDELPDHSQERFRIESY